jgi:signal transduction histidine kinase
VLLFGSDRSDAFTEEHTELLTSVGTQATVALQNAVLYENLLNERNRIVEVEEEARKKLARDLHDGPTQNVAAIAMRMSIIQRTLERTPEQVPAELKKVEEIARKTTKEIRHMLFTLRPLVLENQGIAAALDQLAEKMKETHSQAVAVRVSKEAERALDPAQQGVIFYIIEEAVGNARKHAQAQLISVTVNRQEDVVVIQIADNGVGFDTGAVEANYDSRGSLGMVNLKERTELLGGTLRIESKLGRGTNITVLVPIRDSVTQGSRDRQMRNLASTGSTTKLAAAAVERIRAGGESNHN